MRYYEAIFIAQPNLEQEELSQLIEEAKDTLKKHGGELLYEEVMGKRRLAYSIKKQRFGTYVLLQFQGDGTGNVGFNRDLELKDNILAHMLVRIEKEEVREAPVGSFDEGEDDIADEESDHEEDYEELVETAGEQNQLETETEPEEPPSSEEKEIIEEEITESE